MYFPLFIRNSRLIRTNNFRQSGQAFAYEALSKNGNRPIVYSAIGTHANYAVPGNHSRSVASVVINDTTSAGFLWDPILSAYYYAYNPFPSTINERFTSADSSVPVSWLSFLGRWGDNRYADKDPRQLNFLGLNITWRYESGPRGPFDKGLNRRKVCPDNGSNCTILNALPPISGLSRSIQSSISTSSAAGGTASAMTTLMSSTASAATVTAAATAIINGNQSNSARLLETKLDVAKIVIPVIVVSYNVLN